MKYKHTIEIITNDLKNIEKLVDNFKNYPSIPAIELDLALSKLRNIYDLLLIFRETPEEIPSGAQHLSESSMEEKQHVQPETLTRSTPKQEASVAPTEEIKPDITQEETQAVRSETHDQVISEPEKKEENVDDLSARPSSQEIQTDNSRPEPPPVITETQSSETPKPDPVPREEAKEVKTGKTGSVLGEKYNSDKKYINERLGEQATRPDIKTRLQGTPITSIAGSIGINDKFFLIRELFKGNPEHFRQTMELLDHLPNFNDAYSHLTENFDWDMDSEPAQQLVALIRRKFIARGNE